MAAKTQLTAPYSSSALHTVIHELHEYNSPSLTASPSLSLRHLSHVAQVWHMMMERVQHLHRAGIQPIVQGGLVDCPACFRECVAVSGDACMGLRRFKKSATASRGLPSLHHSTPFLSEAHVQQKLAELRADDDTHAIAEGDCAKFKAAPAILSGNRSQHYDRLGVAALCCRHEHVLQACSLHSEENYTYYEILLLPVMTAYCSPAHKRKLSFFYLDVAC